MARRYDDEFELPETQIRALAILEEIMRIAPRDDLRLRQLLRLLQHQLEVDEQQMQEAMQAIQEYEEAYQKLTSPANRIGVFLNQPDEGVALIALGDSEYYANIDPKLENPDFKVGTRVKVNEAFAVIGDLFGGHLHAPVGGELHALLLQERLLELGEQRVALVDAQAAVAADHAPPRDVVLQRVRHNLSHLTRGERRAGVRRLPVADHFAARNLAHQRVDPLRVRTDRRHCRS